MHRSIFIIGLVAVPVHASVNSSEFASDPVSEGWTQVLQFCEPIVETSGSLYIQNLNMDACPKAGEGAQDAFRREIEDYNGSAAWYLEFRVRTTGDSEDIIFGAPIALSAANSFGVLYHITVADDQLQLIRDLGLPILLIDLEPGIPHTIRLELEENPIPSYSWYINGYLVDNGSAEGGFPADNSTITWRGRAAQFPTTNHWHYIRYGDIPVDASGDFDSDGEVDDFEVFYFDECLSESGAGVDAGPGCRWADMDGDTDVDCDDFDLFADAWTAPGGPPPLIPCVAGGGIPATSHWGAIIMATILLAGATILFRTKSARAPA